jgi:hypothetical protein
MSNEITSYVPRGMAEIKEFCAMVAKSNIVPKEYIGKPENVFVACIKGMDLGLKPLQALECIAVINGKTSLYGDAYLAIARGSGKLENYKEEIVGTGTSMKAVVSVKRKGEDFITSEYTADDAKTAGLWGKSGPWSLHPKRMLTMKARNFALRAAFADVFLGMEYSAEELMEVAESKQNATQQINQVKDITPIVTEAEITEIINFEKYDAPMFAIDKTMMTGLDLSRLIEEKIEAIQDQNDLDLYEIWREGNIDGIKLFCKSNKEICLDFKTAIDRKRHEVLSAE